MSDAVPLRLLYIDDDQAVGRLVQRRLSRVGFHVTLAGNGADGVALAAAGGFDVIALDHHMPGRDGLEVLRDLQEPDPRPESRPNAPPVVFVTATDEPRVAVAALKQGAADFIIKDVQGSFLELLEPTLRNAVRSAGLQRAAEEAQREVRESRDRLEALAAQQAVLLREVDHRVANSLQLISGMIALQARRLEDGPLTREGARDLLQRAADRVEAVALIHRRLYTSHDVANVELDHYLENLVAEFRRALEADGATPRIELEVEPVRVVTDKAVSIGLIVNELVTNALKYAYVGQPPGPVRIWMRRSETGLRLGVEDEGVGYPAGAEGTRAKGTGVGGMIVSAMAKTLRATLTHDAARPGTRFLLEIPA